MFETLNIAQAIQLAIGPVFLLVAIGGLLNVLTNRLARIVDRIRDLEVTTVKEDEGPERDMHVDELRCLDQRIVRIHRSITLCTIAALLVCLVVIALFLEEIFSVDLNQVIAGLFIATMFAILTALGYFLSEIYVAGRILRVSMPFRARPVPRRKRRKGA